MSKKRLYQRQSVNEVDRDWLRDRAVGHGDFDISPIEATGCDFS